MNTLVGSIINLNDEKLIELEQLGSVATSYEDCAIILELPIEQFKISMKDVFSIPAKTYQRGFLKAEFEIKKSIFNMAKNGSGPAQQLAMKLIEEIKINKAINE